MIQCCKECVVQKVPRSKPSVAVERLKVYWERYKSVLYKARCDTPNRSWAGPPFALSIPD